MRSVIWCPSVAALVALVVAVPAVAVAVPPQYPNGWTFAPSGLRQIPTTVDTRGLLQGARRAPCTRSPSAG